MLFRRIASIYVLYFYLAGTGVMPNLAATAAAPLCARPPYRRLALLIIAPLLCSN